MNRDSSIVLIVSIFIVAVCSLVYELIAGAVSSYLLGSSITQFSLVIGIFLAAMGLGSFLSKYVEEHLVARFVQVEIATGLIGGFSAPALFCAFTFTESFYSILVAVTGSVGTLIGLEIPLIIRIFRARESSLRLTIANVMTADYIGALVASLAFPFVLVPHLGLLRTSFLVGLLNLAVGWLCIFWFREEIGSFFGRIRALAIISTVVLTAGFFASTQLVSLIEDKLYPDEIIYAKQTKYQRIVVTRWREDTRLFLDGKLQFSTADEYRYHECLVHPAVAAARPKSRALILGGGDGMAARELLKYAKIKTIHLVDIDPEMTRIFRDIPLLARLNDKAFSNERVTVFNQDAMSFLEKTENTYDIILMDLPDPNNLSLGKLYTLSFYQLAARRLSPEGVMTIQSSSPFFAAKAYWCVVKTVSAVKIPELGEGKTFEVAPYHVNVPSFGEWGYVLASRKKIDTKKLELKVPLRFLNEETLPCLFVFPADLEPPQVEINRLNNQVLVKYYDDGYDEFFE